MKASARHNYRSLLLPDLRNVHDETFTFLDVDGLVDVVVEPLDAGLGLFFRFLLFLDATSV